jgi:hypothetical protein
MKRLLACLLTMCLIFLGCGQSYKQRLGQTLENLRYRQRLDQNLITAPVGKFKDLQVYIRPPKPLEEAKEFQLPSAAVDQFDIAKSFFGSPTSAPEGQAKEKQAEPAAVLRLHVLARVKRPKKPTKKGEAPPPEGIPVAQFVPDVRTIVGTDFGNADAATTATLKNERVGKNNEFKRIFFTSPNNNDEIRMYFYTQGDYHIALVWDVPAALKNAASAKMTLCMESFAVGRKASHLFENGYTGDDMGPIVTPGKGGAGAAGGGQAF